MRKEYDLKKLKVKRRGMLSTLKGTSVENAKIRVMGKWPKTTQDDFFTSSSEVKVDG